MLSPDVASARVADAVDRADALGERRIVHSVAPLDAGLPPTAGGLGS
jgi:hypothetical protein